LEGHLGDFDLAEGGHQEASRSPRSAGVLGVRGGDEAAPVEQLELGDYQYLQSTRGGLLHRLGRTDEPPEAFERALALDAPRFLERRIAEL
jgi:predicted RNA polymerase sigma factor